VHIQYTADGGYYLTVHDPAVHDEAKVKAYRSNISINKQKLFNLSFEQGATPPQRRGADTSQHKQTAARSSMVLG
jgi:hypothetical protein